MIIKEARRLQHIKEYYFSTKLKEIAALKATGKDILNLGIGNPDLRPAHSVLQKLTKETMDPSNHGYQSYRGIPELRNAFSKWYATHFNVELDPEKEILPLIGSKEGIMHISMAFLNKGDKVLTPNPGYPSYNAASRLAGATVIEYPLKASNDWAPDFDALEQQDLSSVKIMWVNYPHMPTGTQADVKLFEKLVAFGQKHQILICNDNPYSFILNDTPKSLLETKGADKVVLELNSLSKSHNMAGWRIGMIAGHEEYIQTILKFKSNMDSGMFLPVQKAAVQALGLPKEWYKEKNEKVYKKRRILVIEILKALDCSYQNNQIGLFIWAKVPDHFKDGYALSNTLLYDTDIFITPGGIFGSEGDKYIRISLCSNEVQLTKALERIVQHCQNQNNRTLPKLKIQA